MKKSNKKILAVSAVSIALVLAMGLFTVVKADSTFLDKVAQYAGEFLGKDLSSKFGDLGEQVFGGSGGVFQTNWYSFGGVEHYASSQTSMAQASTSACSLVGPSSTSTLVFASVQFAYASTTAATTVHIAKAATTNTTATTTILGAATVAANAQATINATTTTEGSLIFAPNELLNVGVQGASSGTLTPSGTCLAEWIVNGR